MSILQNQARRSRVALAGQAFALLVFGSYAVVTLCHRTPPLLGDFSSWEFSGHVLAWHLRGLADPYHAVKFYPVPNSTLTVVLGLLMLLVSWAWAGKITLLLYFLLAYTSIRSLMAATSASPLLWFVLPGAAFLNLNLWWGLIAFQSGIALLFFLVAMLVRRKSSPAKDWPVRALLVLLFFTHMVPFTFACMLLFFFSVQTGRNHLLRQLLLPSLLVCGYIGGRVMHGNVDSAASPTTLPKLLSGVFWFSKVDGFVKSFGFVNPVSDDRLHSAAHAALGTPIFVLLFALNLLLCVALLTVLFRGGGRVVSDHPYAFVWISSVLALLVFLIAPKSLLGISDPGSRILQCVLPVALFFCRPEGWARLGFRAAGLCSIALALGGIAVFVKVPWTYPPAEVAPLSAPIELLGRAPYGYLRGLTDATAAGSVHGWGFSTGILFNLPDPEVSEEHSPHPF
jgi:hypothetical protein